jgi:7,8-dihydropterin-6-yl-methyl-4-(beta-D-ribofuranosyl)aminobenzene 5'-phosphate synthase
VDSLSITTLVDNVFDVFMPDQGPAHRVSPATKFPRVLRRPSSTGAVFDQLVAEHGLSLLLTITKGQQTHRLLFDTGVSPNGMLNNMDRLELAARDFEAIVLSHGLFYHTGGFDGLVRRMGAVNLPVVIHSRLLEPSPRHHPRQ